MREMADTLRSTFQRVLRLENRRRAPRAGRLEKIHAFESKILGNTREITIYLPPTYADRPDARYPVLYMQDGQNLFEPERSFIPGQHWRPQEAADAAIGDRAARADDHRRQSTTPVATNRRVHADTRREAQAAAERMTTRACSSRS